MLSADDRMPTPADSVPTELLSLGGIDPSVGICTSTPSSISPFLLLDAIYMHSARYMYSIIRERERERENKQPNNYNYNSSSRIFSNEKHQLTTFGQTLFVNFKHR